MALEMKADPSKWAQVLVDAAAAPATVYYGFTTFRGTSTADNEWVVLKETVVGTTTTYQWSGFSDGKPQQTVNWDDRATHTYE